ncbi:MAG: nucleotidyltransferase domain-containing protein [Candidatus Caldarchaeales archaeon]
MGQVEGGASLTEALERVRLSRRQSAELARFLRRLKRELNVTEVYLFGSRVYGTPLVDSDLDMLVVSEEFGKRSFVENAMLVSGLWDGSFTIEAFPYTPAQVEAFRERKAVVREAVTKGIRVRL